MRARGHDEQTIRDVATAFARQYKVFRRIEAKVKSVTERWAIVDADFFKRDAIEVMRNSAAGTKFSVETESLGPTDLVRCVSASFSR